MNQYVYTVQATRVAMRHKATDEEQRILAQHAAYMQKLADDDICLFAGATQVQDSRQFGMVIFQADDDEAAQAILQNDPAVKSRIMRGQVMPFRSALWNPDAASLATGQQHYLYLIQAVRHEMLTASTAFEDETVTAHFHYLKDLTEQGVFCAVGRTPTLDYAGFGMGILRATSLEAAWAIGEADPAIQQRIMRLDIQPFDLTYINSNSTLS